MGPWIADFYCHEAALVVEADGSYHRGERKELDAARDTWMNERGVAVLRFTGRQVSYKLNALLATILRTAEDRIAVLRSGRRQRSDAADETP